MELKLLNTPYYVNFTEIMDKSIDYIVDKMYSFLREYNIEFEELYIAEIYENMEDFLFDFVYDRIFFFDIRSYPRKVNKNFIGKIISSYIYLSSSLDDFTFDYMKEFNKKPIQDLLQLFVLVVKRMLAVYLIKYGGVIESGMLIFIRDNIPYFDEIGNEKLWNIIESAGEMGLKVGELIRWMYYFNPDDVIKYLSMGYSLDKALEEDGMYDDEDEGEEDDSDD